jgi:transposase-like protein
MKRILIVAVLSSLATAAVIAATGIAQNDNNSDNKPPPTMKQALADAEKERDARLARIAQRLDVSTEKLKDSIEKVRDAKLDEEVDAGRLTDAQRDAIKACKDNPLTCDRSNLPAFGPELRREIRRAPRGAGKRVLRTRFPKEREDFLEDLAKELGKDVDDVEAAFRAERPQFERRLHGPGGPGGPPPGGPGEPGPGGPGFFGGPGGP